ncbi:MAG: hypothetical protein OEY09_12715 [Gammaproteobacteria bacterium]|nr:hypothetical protein [Gammaproteobacteria bacterium]
MRIPIVKAAFVCTLIAIISFPGISLSAPLLGSEGDLRGHFSREGNSSSSSKTTRNNIYIKFFPERWIGMLFIPYPYATSVEPEVVTRVFEAAKKQTSGSAYIKGKFGHLAELATVHIERYGYLEDRIVFECGSLAPCTIKLADGSLELIKPGVINEHIIRYLQIDTP